MRGHVARARMGYEGDHKGGCALGDAAVGRTGYEGDHKGGCVLGDAAGMER